MSKNKKEQIDFEKECYTLPNEELRKIYTSLRRQQNRWSKIPAYVFVPAFLFYGIAGWFAFFGAGLVNGRGLLDFINITICAIFMTSRNPKTLSAVPFIMLILSSIKLCFFGHVNIITALAILYTFIFGEKLRRTVIKLNFLRGLPNYPFESRQMEMNFNALSRQKMLEYMEREAGGGVKAVNYENIFISDDPESIVNPPEDKEIYLQQHEFGRKFTDKEIKRYLERERQAHSSDINQNDEEYLQKSLDYEDFTPQELQMYNDKYSKYSSSEYLSENKWS